MDDEISLENEESFDNEKNDKIVEDVVKEEIKEEKNVENISSIVEKKRVFDIEMEHKDGSYILKSKGTLVLYDDYWMQGIIRFYDVDEYYFIEDEDYFIGGIFVPERECVFPILATRRNYFHLVSGKFVNDQSYIRYPNEEMYVGKSAVRTCVGELINFGETMTVFTMEKEYETIEDKARDIAEIELKGSAWLDHPTYKKSLLKREDIGKSLKKQYGKN